MSDTTERLLRDIDNFLAELLERGGAPEAAAYRERIRRWIALTPCSTCEGTGRVEPYHCPDCQNPFRRPIENRVR